MKTCFSAGKTMKQFGVPPHSGRTPISTKPPISEQFFHDPLFVQILKTRNPPNFKGGETMKVYGRPYQTSNAR